MAKGGRANPSKQKESSKGGQAVDYESPRPAPAALPLDPLTPRPGLLAALAVVFGLWMAFLVFLYVTTIHPRRTASPASGPAAMAVDASHAYSRS
jgi:hypothetical protein